MPADVQLRFACRSCGLIGLTPEVNLDEAVRLARSELELWCPQCGSILAIQTSEAEILAELESTSVLNLLSESLRPYLKKAEERD